MEHVIDIEPGSDNALEDFDDERERLVQLLAKDPSRVRAAKELGISTRTIRRRLEEPGFKRRVSDARTELQAASWTALLGLRDKSARVLDESLESEDERVRLQAAKYVYEMSERVRREQINEEMAQRVADLEERLTQDGGSGAHE